MARNKFRTVIPVVANSEQHPVRDRRRLARDTTFVRRNKPRDKGNSLSNLYSPDLVMAQFKYGNTRSSRSTNRRDQFTLSPPGWHKSKQTSYTLNSRADHSRGLKDTTVQVRLVARSDSKLTFSFILFLSSRSILTVLCRHKSGRTLRSPIKGGPSFISHYHIWFRYLSSNIVTYKAFFIAQYKRTYLRQLHVKSTTTNHTIRRNIMNIKEQYRDPYPPLKKLYN